MPFSQHIGTFQIVFHQYDLLRHIKTIGQTMVEGTVLRSHSGGYLVHSDELRITLQCAARGRLKKERVSIVTGDFVELEEIEAEKGTGVIVTRLPRRNLLTRPQIANVDQAVVVQAIHQPEWNPLLCDRYLVHCQLELPDSNPLLCLNKADLAEHEDLKNLRTTYEDLGYTVLVVSAYTGKGLEELAHQLAGKISVLAGPSGVGKSSLINCFDPALSLKVGIMENEFGVGRHTTTYSELYRIKFAVGDEKTSSWVADTPGFSVSELKHPEPSDVTWQFAEIAALAEQCKFSNCLHLVEQGCNILANLDKIAESRYQSYCAIVAEAQAEQKLQRDTSQKFESNVKIVGGGEGTGKAVPRLSGRYRAPSRRREKQQVATESDTELFEEDEEVEAPEVSED
jgi:ribosome biogenesis GTPase / thiamine phosphate phosphatase